MDIRFCYRIAAAAEMAYDESGAPSEAFMQVKLGGAKRLPEDYDKSHASMGKKIAMQHGLDPEWVIPISTDEYDRETAEDDDSLLDCPCGCGMDPCLES